MNNRKGKRKRAEKKTEGRAKEGGESMKAAAIEVKQHVKRTTQANKQQYKKVKVVKGQLIIPWHPGPRATKNANDRIDSYKCSTCYARSVMKLGQKESG